MKCPSCSTELKMSERQGIEIEYCPQCPGVWHFNSTLEIITDSKIKEIKTIHDDNFHTTKIRIF